MKKNPKDPFNDVFHHLLKIDFARQVTSILGQHKFSIQAYVETIVALYAPLAAAKGLEIMYMFDPHVPLYVLGDAERFFILLHELVDNAVKFSEAKTTVVIKVLLREKQEGQATIILEVRDQGKGMTRDEQYFISKRFNWLPASYDTTSLGTGCGINLVKQYMRDMGARLYIKSLVDVGSVFECTFHFALPPAQDETSCFPVDLAFPPIHIPQMKAKKSLNAFKILLVEDDPAAIYTAHSLFHKFGCHFEYMTTGEGALVRLGFVHYDLILMDLSLPNQSSAEIAYTVTNRQKLGKQPLTPIVGLSETPLSPEQQTYYRQMGMAGILRKPLQRAYGPFLLSFFGYEGLA